MIEDEDDVVDAQVVAADYRTIVPLKSSMIIGRVMPVILANGVNRCRVTVRLICKQGQRR